MRGVEFTWHVFAGSAVDVDDEFAGPDAHVGVR
jgi:hypothetical protein